MKLNVLPNEDGGHSMKQIITIRLNQDLLVWIKEQTKKENRTVTNFIETILIKERNKK